MRKFFITVVLSILVLSAGACAGNADDGAVPTQTPQAAVEKAIVLGDISDDPAEVIDGTQPLARYLADQLGAFGITTGRVRVAKSIDEMAELLANGEVDLYFDSTYPATVISDASGAKILLRRWRFGVEEYHSVIFASKESGIQSLEDLNGQMLAFDAPYSTSGFVLPAVHLAENGLNLSGKPGYGESVAADEAGYVFSYDDENTLQWVLSDLVQAGATDDYHFDVAFPAEATEKLVALARTESIPRQVMVARADLDPELLDAIIQILLTIDQDEAAQPALEAFQTTKFDEFPEGIEAATQRMRDMMQTVQGIPQP